MKKLISRAGLVKNTPVILFVNGARSENDDVAFRDYYLSTNQQ